MNNYEIQKTIIDIRKIQINLNKLIAQQMDTELEMYIKFGHDSIQAIQAFENLNVTKKQYQILDFKIQELLLLISNCDISNINNI